MRGTDKAEIEATSILTGMQLRRLLTVEDHSVFSSALQCPVLVSETDTRVELLVASRTSNGKSQVLAVSIDVSSSHKAVHLRFVLTSEWVSKDCIGLMPGCIYASEGGGSMLLIQAFFRRAGLFASEVFRAPVTVVNGVIVEIAAPEPLLVSNDRPQFFGTPQVVSGIHGKYLVVCSPGPAHGASRGFPEAYGLHVAPYKEDLINEYELSQLFWPQPTHRWAVASLARLSDASPICLTSLRAVGQQGGSYSLVGFQLPNFLTGSGTFRSSYSPTHYSNIGASYPTIAQGHETEILLASLGRYGSQGIGWTRLTRGKTCVV